MNKKLFLLLCICNFYANAQIILNDKDSLTNLYNNSKYIEAIVFADSLTKITTNHSILYELLYQQYRNQNKIDNTKSIHYLWKIKSLKKISIQNKIKLFYYLGLSNYRLNKLDSSSFYLFNSIKINQRNKKILGLSYQRLAYIFDKTDNDSLQYYYLHKSLSIYKKLNNNKKLIYLYNSLGTLFSKNKQTIDSALLYYRRALLLPIKHKLKGTINQNIGAIYLGQKNEIDSAKFYFKKALKHDLSDLSNAMIYFNKAVISKDEKKLKETIIFYQKSMFFSKKVKDLNNQLHIHRDLSRLYDSIGIYKKANVNYKLAHSLQDSIFKLDLVKSINELDKKYKIAEKDKLIILSETKRKKSQNLFYGTLIFLFLVGTTGFLFLKNSKKKRLLAEQQKELEKQKNLTLLKEQEIMAINAMIKGQEKERIRIAEDLHDNIGSVLATLKLHFENLKLNREKKHFNQDELYEKTENLIDETYLKVRSIAHAKNAGVIANKGLLVAIKIMAEKISDANKIDIHVLDFGLNKRLENNLEITIFRLIQELITNIIKHANATEATINISLFDENLNIIIEDNGKGFNYNNTMLKEGMGINSIKTRIKYLNGTFNVDSTIGKGTSIIMDIPVI